MAATVVVVLFLLLSFSVFAVSCNDSVLRLSKNNHARDQLFLAVLLPSATYGLSSIHTNETLDFLDEVQGRLIKAWFGVSKYCSTSSLRAAIGWRKASEFHISTSTEPKCIPYFQSPFTCPLIRGVIWGFGTATACITSGVVPPHAIPSIILALAV